MWAAVKAFVCMAGAAAEAQFTNRPLHEIANGYEWENDLEGCHAILSCCWDDDAGSEKGMQWRTELGTRGI